MSFDLSLFEISETADLHLKLADGSSAYNDDKPVIIRIYGKDSKVARTASLKLVRRLDALNKKRGKDRLPDESELEKIKELNVEFLAAITAGWENMPVKFSREEAVNIYSNYTIIREQVDDFAKDRDAYVKKS